MCFLSGQQAISVEQLYIYLIAWLRMILDPALVSSGSFGWARLPARVRTPVIFYKLRHFRPTEQGRVQAGERYQRLVELVALIAGDNLEFARAFRQYYLERDAGFRAQAGGEA